MATQVSVILRALNGNLSPPKRVLKLNPDCFSIPIGRASKSTNKGLQGAEDNGWFDSPVMSRDHAVISLDLEDNKITIKDIGSMHGTLLNNIKVPRNEPKQLHDGDELIFGAEVRRGPETFPACSFSVTYTIEPYRISNTFAFPESSDIDEEEEYNFSDEDIIDEHASSMNGIPIEFPKDPQSINAIDLTGDETQIQCLSLPIDLTGETPAANKPREVAVSRLAMTQDNTPPASNAQGAENIPSVVQDSDDEVSNFSSDLNDLSDVAESEIDSSLNLEEMADMEDEDVTDKGIGSSQPHRELQKEFDLQNTSHFSLDQYGKIPVQISDLRTGIELPADTIGDGEEDEDFGLLQAGAEGMKAMFDEALLEHDSGTSYLISKSDDQETRELQFSIPETRQTRFDPAGSPTLQLNSKIPLFPVSTKYLSSCTSANSDVPATTTSFARQPSPSDAAMVKTSNVHNSVPSTGQMTATHTTGANDIKNHTAQSLGERSGKMDFFEAREENKATMKSAESQPKGATERVIKPCVGKLSRYPTHSNSVDPFLETSRGSHVTTSSEPSSFATVPIPNTVYSFLDTPSASSLSSQTPGLEPDMTSAAKYLESKISISNQATSLPQNRCGLRIDEICDKTLGNQETRGLKRKADTISNAVEEEVRIWGSNITASSNPSDHFVPKTKIFSCNQISTVPTSRTLLTVEQRPVKRFKKLMENAAYAALGGVAVGAALFGGLVATAPDFM